MLRRLALKGVYKSDEDNILEDFYMPALSVARSYDRAVGFFSAATLSYAAQAISTFVDHDGRMRLILGAFADAEDIEAVQKGFDARELSERLGQELLKEIDKVDDDLFRNRFEALAWLVAKGRLDVKVEGLVLVATGANPVTTFRGLVSCQTIDGTGAAAVTNVSTDPFPASTTGNSKIAQTLDLPEPCIAPIVFVTSPGGAWFAATGV